jgi:hypothetical protein
MPCVCKINPTANLMRIRLLTSQAESKALFIVEDRRLLILAQARGVFALSAHQPLSQFDIERR